MPETVTAPAAPSGQGPTVGKASAPAAKTPSTPSGGAVGKPVFEYEWEDGTKESFATEEEHRKAWRDGRLRHKDYTKKTMELAEKQKAFENERKSLDQIAQDARKLHGQWKPIDDWMKTRPDVRDYILKNMKIPSPEAITEQVRGAVGGDLDELKGQLKELSEWKSKREEEEKKKKAYEYLSSQYEDFDPSQIEEELTKWNEHPDEDDLMNTAETLYFAMKGRQAPKKVGETVVAGPATSARKMPPVPSAKQMREEPEEKPKSLREAAERWKRKHASE